MFFIIIKIFFYIINEFSGILIHLLSILKNIYILIELISLKKNNNLIDPKLLNGSVLQKTHKSWF